MSICPKEEISGTLEFNVNPVQTEGRVIKKGLSEEVREKDLFYLEKLCFFGGVLADFFKKK